MNEITPIICAEFKLDKHDKPIAYVHTPYKHYLIKIFIENAPEDTHAVTYELHESYVDPVREVFKGKDTPNFELYITSYGDYEIKAKIRQKNYSKFISRGLSEALRETYKNTSNPDIQDAINDIEKY